jgi:hypothetical protein
VYHEQLSAHCFDTFLGCIHRTLYNSSVIDHQPMPQRATEHSTNQRVAPSNDRPTVCLTDCLVLFNRLVHTQVPREYTLHEQDDTTAAHHHQLHVYSQAADRSISTALLQHEPPETAQTPSPVPSSHTRPPPHPSNPSHHAAGGVDHHHQQHALHVPPVRINKAARFMAMYALIATLAILQAGSTLLQEQAETPGSQLRQVCHA